MRRSVTIMSAERLESRRLPATLVSPQIVRFQDLDGDTVLVSLSRPILTAGNVDSVFRFTTGGVSGDDVVRQGLLDIRLSALGSAARGVNLRVLVSARAAGGSSDGVASVGQISAEGVDLGSVRIDGALGRIRSGDANLLTPGLRSLTVTSLGTGAVPTGSDHRSLIQGRVDAIRSGDLRGSIDVQGGAAGQIGTLEVSGAIVGDATDGSGRVTATGAIATAHVGSVRGGDGERSGRIEASSFRSIQIRSVSGGLLGGAGNESGSIAATGTIGRVAIANAIEGGRGAGSGQIRAGGAITRLEVGRIVGGIGEASGSVFAAGAVTYVNARGAIQGGDGRLSGSIGSATRVGIVSCDRLVGGSGEMSGTVYAQRSPGTYSPPTDHPYQSIDWVRAHNGIVGGAGASSGSIVADHLIRTVEVTNRTRGLVGGGGRDSGTVRSGDWSGQGAVLGGDFGGIFSIKLPRIVGGVGARSGSVLATSFLRGDAPYELVGGAGDESGTIVAHDVALPGTFGGSRATRPGPTDIRGGSGYASGSVRGARGTLGIRDLIGGEGERSGSLEFSESATVYAYDIRGGAGSYSGRVSAPALTLTAANILGGSATGATDLVESGAVVAETLFIRLRAPVDVPRAGELRAGSDFTSGAFARNGAIIAVTINGTIGRITGNETAMALVAAVETIGSLTVTQTVTRGLIVAGRGFGASSPRTGMPFDRNPDARIGTVRINGDFIASSIAAGVRPVDAFYGNVDDAPIDASESYPDDPSVSSSIERVEIRGDVFGTSAGGDSFGIVAQHLGVVRVGWTGAAWRSTYAASPTASRRGLVDTSTADVFLVALGPG